VRAEYWSAEHLANRAARGRLGRGSGRPQGRGSGNLAIETRSEASGRGERDPAQGRRGFCQGDRVTKFVFVSAERGNHVVAMLCRIVGVSVSGFYAWLRAIPAVHDRAEVEADLRGHINRIFSARRRVYGSPRIHAELRREGRRHSRRRIERLMHEMGLSARQGRRRTPRTTNSRHDLPIAPNLLARNFTAERPDQVWLSDISNWRRLALRSSNQGYGDVPDRRLVDGRPSESRSVHRRSRDGVAALSVGTRPDPPQRSRRSVRLDLVSICLATPRDHSIHEPAR
jgi:HTH-like domain